METPDFTGERAIPDANARTSLLLEHLTRYHLAARLAAGKRVLDAACGVGYGARLLADAGAAEVTGVDIDEESIRYADKRYGGPGVSFRVDDVTGLATVEDGSVDLFVSFETIEHVDDVPALFRQVARVLSPEGLFVCSTPNWEVSRNRNPFHVREYTYAEFFEALRTEFPHVRVLLQRNLVAGRIVGVDAETERQDPGPPERSFRSADEAEDIGSAPYFIGLATRAGEIPSLHLLHLGEAADVERKNQYIQNLEGGLADRDARITALEEQARAAEQVRERVEELEAEREQRNRYIQNLEGGLADRDARIRDLEIQLTRPETFYAVKLVRFLMKMNRKLGRLPSRTLKRWLRSGRVAAGRTPATAKETAGPRFSIVVPVYQHVEYLAECVDSALGQTFPDFEVILYDDASPDPRVREILEGYRGRPRAKVVFGEENLGISRATNRAIAHASGRFVAFLDCDDCVDPDALERVARFLDERPEVDFVYTNRVDVDESGAEVERWNFVNRSLTPPDEELLKGMFASHFKVIRRTAFLGAGLFRSELDAVQDYDLALRLSETCTMGFLEAYPYRHRVHTAQITQASDDRHARLADEARARALLRRRMLAGDRDGLVSIVILSLNRVDDTRKCLEAIARHTPQRHEILIVDNASAPAELARLREIAARWDTVTLIEEPENRGVAGGRNLGASRARGNYLVFLDNDIVVTEAWLGHLLTEMEADPGLAACCCRVIFPDGTVQFTGGATVKGADRVKFVLLDTGRPADDLGTLEVHDCDWVPGGATIFRKSVFDRIPYDTTLAGAFEDNDWSISAKAAGHRLGNAPLATVVHHHLNYSPSARKDKQYVNQRYSKERLERTLRRFHEKHGVIIDEEELYRFVGYSGSDEFLAGLESAAPASGAHSVR